MNTKNSSMSTANKLARGAMVAVLAVAAMGMGGCASVSPENAKYGTTGGVGLTEVSSNFDAAYHDASPNNDAIAYAIVHSGSAIVPGFSVSNSNKEKFMEAMRKADDVRLAEMDKFVFVKAVMATTPNGRIPADTLVPKDVATKLKTGDILEVKVPNSSRPAYFIGVVSHECKWEGSFYYGIYTPGGNGVRCQNGWYFKNDLPLAIVEGVFKYTIVPGPGSAIVKARKAAETSSK
jgi:hypothetical protein